MSSLWLWWNTFTALILEQPICKFIIHIIYMIWSNINKTVHIWNRQCYGATIQYHFSVPIFDLVCCIQYEKLKCWCWHLNTAWDTWIMFQMLVYNVYSPMQGLRDILTFWDTHLLFETLACAETSTSFTCLYTIETPAFRLRHQCMAWNTYISSESSVYNFRHML